MKESKPDKSAALVQPERTNFHAMLAKNPNYFGNLAGSKLAPNFKLITETSYEQLTCVGYNPDTGNMEATFSIKRSTGYSGNLCHAGSFEHVRFYLDFHDNQGFIDQGSVAVNVHDIPAADDCKGESIFPIKYVATLKKKTSKSSFCENPVLPTLRAILSWSVDPPPATPDWNPVWGNAMDCDVQLKPFWKFILPEVAIGLSDFFSLAVSAPNLSAKQLTEISGFDFKQLNPQSAELSLVDVAKQYEKSKVPASRYAFKTVHSMVKYPTSEITMMQKTVLSDLKVDINSIIDQLTVILPVDTSKANVDYEELECIGLDYNTESLIATIKIKKNLGYSGSLCDAGSKEYISFWIDWDGNCSWQYLNTLALKVHDITMKGDGLCYSVSMPLDATYHRKICENPNVVRIRSVLSWNVAPSTTDPDKLEYYGNRVDAHIQIKPGVVIAPGQLIPIYTIIGGIDVDHVNDASGLTKPGSFFAYNGTSVPTAAPFGGIIVLNGPTFPGHRYRIKVTNLDTAVSYYAMDTLHNLVGWLPNDPWVQYTNNIPEPGTGYYDFLPTEKNILNILARFNPGTENRLLVELEVEGVLGSFAKTIQMDNTAPVVQIQVDDGGDCTHYAKGDTITGHYYVNDLHISSWSFGSTWGGNASGTSNTPGMPGTAFSIATPANAYPCGGVWLGAWDKTIVDSQYVGHYAPASYNICLKG